MIVHDSPKTTTSSLEMHCFTQEVLCLPISSHLDRWTYTTGYIARYAYPTLMLEFVSEENMWGLPRSSPLPGTNIFLGQAHTLHSITTS